MQTPRPTETALGSLFPQFRNLTEIGVGGFETVFRGEVHGMPEVLKTIGIPHVPNPDDEEAKRYQEECIARVRREYGILERCENPFMVKLASLPLGEHEIDGEIYSIYSEEFLHGDDLGKIIRAKTRVPDEAECKTLMRCLLVALKELWSMRYVHRDIKPANVIKLNDPDRPFVLIDLGIAFGVLETGLTVQGIPCTARYMAPEMGNPAFRTNLDYRSDLYTIALTVFEFAASQHPIARDSDDPIRTITRALHQPAKPLKDLRPDFSDGFCRLIDQLLKKKPALRPGNLDFLIAQTQN